MASDCYILVSTFGPTRPPPPGGLQRLFRLRPGPIGTAPASLPLVLALPRLLSPSLFYLLPIDPPFFPHLRPLYVLLSLASFPRCVFPVRLRGPHPAPSATSSPGPLVTTPPLFIGAASSSPTTLLRTPLPPLPEPPARQVSRTGPLVFSPHLSGAPMPTRGGGSNLGIGEAAAFISHFITMNPNKPLVNCPFSSLPQGHYLEVFLSGFLLSA